MPVSGRKLTIEEALALCHAVGFRARDELVTAVSVMSAESGRGVESWNVNTNGSIDRGLFQINTIHQSLGMANSFKAVPNAEFAFLLSDGGVDFTPWNAFKSGAHERFSEEVLKVFRRDEQAWRELVPTIRERLA
jgi:hypothetical protein